MANTFTRTTKASLSTSDVTSSSATNVVTVSSTATIIILSDVLRASSDTASGLDITVSYLQQT